MQYDCRIDGELLICKLIADRDLRAPIFCFSGMAPLAPVSGGTLQRSVGSYTEVALPDLAKGTMHEVQIKYQEGFKPANRAWMPLGPYLLVDGEIMTLPPTPSGRVQAPKKKRGPIDSLPVVPQPAHWHPRSDVITVDGFAFQDDALQAVEALANRQGKIFAGSFPVTLKVAEMPQDAYTLEITENGITLTANSYGGRFYAGVTLLSLLQQGPLPCGKISDKPRFGWRGQHLDTARHFYQPDTIFALLDLMAMLKLNRFHWHFADDEAFRIEIDSIPRLWQETALRGQGQALPGLFNGAPVEGGTYSKQDVRDIVDHAKQLNIEVLPEIEAPAHALAITTLYPETRDPDDTGSERSVQGYARNALNPAMPKTWEILEAIVYEIGQLFPFEHIHLGCDELPKDTWMNSPKAREFMAKNGLTTTHDLQGWTIAKLASFARARGLRPAAWEEASQGCQGGIGNDAILFSWTGQGPGIEAARAGYDVVMTPAQHVYLDMAHTDDPDDWGASWAAFVDLEDTINWNPVPNETLAERIIGVQGAFWSEFTTADTQIWPMLMPRMLGVSAMAWQETPPTPETLLALAGVYSLDDCGKLTLS